MVRNNAMREEITTMTQSREKASETIGMSVAEFVALPPHPRQRGTENRAAQARKTGNRFHEYDETHRHVEAASWDGRVYKVNGHTRAWLWGEGHALPPHGDVSVVLYRPETYEAFIELYNRFDSPEASEKAAEKVQGALRQYGVHVHSNMFSKGNIVTALRMGSPIDLPFTKIDVYDAVRSLRQTIELVDRELSPTPKKVGGAILPAVFLTVAAHGENAIPFWRSLIADSANQCGGRADPPTKLRRLLDDRIARGTAFSRNNVSELFPYAIAAYLAWCKGTVYSTSRKSSLRPAKSHDINILRWLAAKRENVATN